MLRLSLLLHNGLLERHTRLAALGDAALVTQSCVATHSVKKLARLMSQSSDTKCDQNRHEAYQCNGQPHIAKLLVYSVSSDVIIRVQFSFVPSFSI